MTNKLIKLNHHRLLNGDATNKNDVDLLIGDCKINLLLTDPPYGINIVNTNGGGQIGGQGGTAIRPFTRERERERERANGNNWRSQTTKLQKVNSEQSEHQQNQASTKRGGQPAYGKVGKPRRCTTKTLQTSNR